MTQQIKPVRFNTEAFRNAIESLNELANSSNTKCRNLNPIDQEYKNLDQSQLTQVLVNYSWFGRNIVSFLYQGMNVLDSDGFNHCGRELRTNLTEEFNVKSSQGDIITHYALLTRGCKETFGLNVSKIHPSKAMHEFSEKITALMMYSSSLLVAGALYYLELIATEEFVMTTDWMNQTCEVLKVVPSRNLRVFFEIHRDDVEAGHEQRFLDHLKLDCCEKELSNFDEFIQGANQAESIIAEMWKSVHRELSEM